MVPVGKHLQHGPLHPRRLVGFLKGGTQTPAWVIGASVAGLVVVVGGVAVGVLSSQGSGSASVVAADPVGSGHSSGRSTTTTDPPPGPITVTSVTPANGATGVGGSASVTVSFSGTLAASTPMASLSPAVAGTWRRGVDTMTFTPAGGYIPMTTETLTIPGGPAGVLSASGATLTKGAVDHFTVAQGSTLRLQQLMSVIGYSPLTWAPSGTPISATDTAAQAAAAFSPPAGSFAWRQAGWPTNLTALWQPGSYNAMTKGLVMAFEADHGLTVDGIDGPLVWAALFHAVATGYVNTGGYNFALASESRPETLTIWHDGKVVLHSLANTGISVAPTALGTFNVYERLPYQVMKGTNPDGSHYADPVKYVAYFNGGDAIHYFPRYSFGFPQSLGCVELPPSAAAQAYPYTSYGTVVQVVG